MFFSILKKITDLNREQKIFFVISLSIFFLPFLVIKRILNRAGSGLLCAIRTNHFELKTQSCTGALEKFNYAFSDILFISLFFICSIIIFLFALRKIFFLPKFNTDKLEEKHSQLPKGIDWFCGGIIGLLIVIFEIILSYRIGRLDYIPYDGMGSVTTAINIYEGILHLNFKQSIGTALNGINGLWSGLIALNFLVFGTGEWQIYAARFYPIFFCSSLILWVSRYLKSPWLAFLPIFFFLSNRWIITSSYLCAPFDELRYADYKDCVLIDDMRPDFLASTFLLFSVVFLAKNIDSLSKKVFVYSALFLSLAIWAKPTQAPFCCLLWLLVVGFSALSNKHSLKKVFECIMYATIPLITITYMLVYSGGFTDTVLYIMDQNNRKWIYFNDGGWWYYFKNYHLFYSLFHCVIFILLNALYFYKSKRISKEVFVYYISISFSFVMLGIHYFKNPAYGITLFFLLGFLGSVLLVNILEKHENSKIIKALSISIILVGISHQIYIFNFSEEWTKSIYGINYGIKKSEKVTLNRLIADVTSNSNNSHFLAVLTNPAMPEGIFVRNYLRLEKKDLALIPGACFALSETDAQAANKNPEMFNSIADKVNKSCKLILVGKEYTELADPKLEPFHNILRLVVKKYNYKLLNTYDFEKGYKMFKNYEGTYELYEKK